MTSIPIYGIETEHGGNLKPLETDIISDVFVPHNPDAHTLLPDDLVLETDNG